MKMKRTIKFLVIAGAIAGSIPCAQAQVSATASVTATIVNPITITKTADLRFGNVAVLSSTAGTVDITPAGVRSPGGGVTLPATTGTVGGASFTIAGESGYTYAITLPTDPLDITSGANTMTVTAFVSSPANTGTLTGGTETLRVGATLNVDAGQPTGTYTSETPFTVEVNYN